MKKILNVNVKTIENGIRSILINDPKSYNSLSSITLKSLITIFPVLASSKIIQEVNRIGREQAPHACATVGHMQVFPNSRNVIPGNVFLTVDFRHPNDNILTRMDETLKAYCNQLEISDLVEVSVIDFWYFPPTPFDETCVQTVRDSAETLRYSQMDIVSGAGHDACQVCAVAPTGMIFVPCEGGISHNESENATPEDLEKGCNVLLHAMLASAGT